MFSQQFLDVLHEEWVKTFELRFGGLDFWRSSKKWKHIRYKQMADIIMLDLKMISEDFQAFREEYTDYTI